MEKESRVFSGHRISLNGLDLEVASQLQDDVNESVSAKYLVVDG